MISMRANVNPEGNVCSSSLVYYLVWIWLCFTLPTAFPPIILASLPLVLACIIISFSFHSLLFGNIPSGPQSVVANWLRTIQIDVLSPRPSSQLFKIVPRFPLILNRFSLILHPDIKLLIVSFDSMAGLRSMSQNKWATRIFRCC